MGLIASGCIKVGGEGSFHWWCRMHGHAVLGRSPNLEPSYIQIEGESNNPGGEQSLAWSALLGLPRRQPWAGVGHPRGEAARFRLCASFFLCARPRSRWSGQLWYPEPADVLLQTGGRDPGQRQHAGQGLGWSYGPCGCTLVVPRQACWTKLESGSHCRAEHDKAITVHALKLMWERGAGAIQTIASMLGKAWMRCAGCKSHMCMFAPIDPVASMQDIGPDPPQKQTNKTGIDAEAGCRGHSNHSQHAGQGLDALRCADHAGQDHRARPPAGAAPCPGPVPRPLTIRLVTCFSPSELLKT